MTHSVTAVSGNEMQKTVLAFCLSFLLSYFGWVVGGWCSLKALFMAPINVHCLMQATHILRLFKQFHKFRLKFLQF